MKLKMYTTITGTCTGKHISIALCLFIIAMPLTAQVIIKDSIAITPRTIPEGAMRQHHPHKPAITLSMNLMPQR